MTPARPIHLESPPPLEEFVPRASELQPAVVPRDKFQPFRPLPEPAIQHEATERTEAKSKRPGS